jgi:pathogenesis-related protein 1
MSVILVTAAILTVQLSSMLQNSYAQSRLDANSQNTIVDIHNRERAAVGVPPLTWSDSVAAGAQNWADNMLSTGVYKHSTLEQLNGQGENMVAGMGANYPLLDMIHGWVNEKQYYHGQPIEGTLGAPDATYGHYTQMVWNSTTEIGCGYATNDQSTYFVCRYSPAGNILGQTAYGQGAPPPPAATNATAPATNAPPPPAAVGEEQNTLGDQGATPPPAVGEEQNTLGDQGAAGQDAGAPPADQAVVEEEVGGEVIQEQPPQ